MKRLIRKSHLNKLAAWESLEVSKPMAVPGYGEGDSSVETYYERGMLEVSTLDYAVGFNGEDHQWHEDENGNKYFGRYSAEKWQEFLDDIKVNGIREPIQVELYPNGTFSIWEGNHRLAAARQLGLHSIPAEVHYMGGAEKNFKILSPLNLD